MSDRDEDGKRFREYCCRAGENIHPERRGWDTETFTVIRHHHEAANTPSALTSETTMNPDKTNKKRGEKSFAIRQQP
jgi:hypothetical protein